MEITGATPPVFPLGDLIFMALKKIGRAEWLGVNHGGMGYFVKYCTCCKKKIYLTEDELKEFLLATYVPRLWDLVCHYFKLRLSFPKIRFNVEWQNRREMEIVDLNERIEIADNKKLKIKDPKEFSRSFFDEKYRLLGGVEKLEEMVQGQMTPTAIGEWFGFSRQRAFDILQSYKFGKVI